MLTEEQQHEILDKVDSYLVQFMVRCVHDDAKKTASYILAACDALCQDSDVKLVSDLRLQSIVSDAKQGLSMNNSELKNLVVNHLSDFASKMKSENFYKLCNALLCNNNVRFSLENGIVSLDFFLKYIEIADTRDDPGFIHVAILQLLGEKLFICTAEDKVRYLADKSAAIGIVADMRRDIKALSFESSLKDSVSDAVTVCGLRKEYLEYILASYYKIDYGQHAFVMLDNDDSLCLLDAVLLLIKRCSMNQQSYDLLAKLLDLCAYNVSSITKSTLEKISYLLDGLDVAAISLILNEMILRCKAINEKTPHSDANGSYVLSVIDEVVDTLNQIEANNDISDKTARCKKVGEILLSDAVSLLGCDAEGRSLLVTLGIAANDGLLPGAEVLLRNMSVSPGRELLFDHVISMQDICQAKTINNIELSEVCSLFESAKAIDVALRGEVFLSAIFCMTSFLGREAVSNIIDFVASVKESNAVPGDYFSAYYDIILMLNERQSSTELLNVFSVFCAQASAPLLKLLYDKGVVYPKRSGGCRSKVDSKRDIVFLCEHYAKSDGFKEVINMDVQHLVLLGDAYHFDELYSLGQKMGFYHLRLLLENCRGTSGKKTFLHIKEFVNELLGNDLASFKTFLAKLTEYGIPLAHFIVGDDGASLRAFLGVFNYEISGSDDESLAINVVFLLLQVLNNGKCLGELLNDGYLTANAVKSMSLAVVHDSGMLEAGFVNIFKELNIVVFLRNNSISVEQIAELIRVFGAKCVLHILDLVNIQNDVSLFAALCECVAKIDIKDDIKEESKEAYGEYFGVFCSGLNAEQFGAVVGSIPYLHHLHAIIMHHIEKEKRGLRRGGDDSKSASGSDEQSDLGEVSTSFILESTHRRLMVPAEVIYPLIEKLTDEGFSWWFNKKVISWSKIDEYLAAGGGIRTNTLDSFLSLIQSKSVPQKYFQLDGYENVPLEILIDVVDALLKHDFSSRGVLRTKDLESMANISPEDAVLLLGRIAKLPGSVFGKSYKKHRADRVMLLQVLDYILLGKYPGYPDLGEVGRKECASGADVLLKVLANNPIVGFFGCNDVKGKFVKRILSSWIAEYELSVLCERLKVFCQTEVCRLLGEVLELVDEKQVEFFAGPQLETLFLDDNFSSEHVIKRLEALKDFYDLDTPVISSSKDIFACLKAASVGLSQMQRKNVVLSDGVPQIVHLVVLLLQQVAGNSDIRIANLCVDVVMKMLSNETIGSANASPEQLQSLGVKIEGLVNAVNMLVPPSDGLPVVISPSDAP